MNTGLFIRAQVKEKWDAYDIGEPELSDEQVFEWLGTKDTHYLQSVVMALLGRPMPNDG